MKINNQYPLVFDLQFVHTARNKNSFTFTGIIKAEKKSAALIKTLFL
jgi:hypothetical protein